MQWLIFSLIYAWTNERNREGRDLRRHCAHYDVIVMSHLLLAAANESVISEIRVLYWCVGLAGSFHERGFDYQCLIRIAKLCELITCDDLCSIYLTHCRLATPYSDIELVNIGYGNGLMPTGTKPLPEPILTLISMRFSGMHLRVISLNCSMIQSVTWIRK